MKLRNLFDELLFDHQEIILVSNGNELRGDVGAMREMLSVPVLGCDVTGLEGLDSAKLKVWIGCKEEA